MKNPDRRFSRREAALLCGAGLMAPGWTFSARAQPGKMLARPIPHGNGEMLPSVGLGTSIVFNVAADSPQRAGLDEVVRALVAGGGSLIDTAPSYGRAENVIGEILAQTGLRPKIFISTKLEDYRPGSEEAETRDLLQRLRVPKVDLLHLHNVRNANQSLDGLNALKAKGLCRYTGITTTFENAYGATEAILKRTRPDFLEIDYAIDNREAENRLLPAAADAGSAVLVALPFGRGRLFRTALGKKLPEWAAEFDCASWGQFFLKFILSHPAVTAVIPGTSKAEHMVDNLGAGRGRLPDAAMRARMIAYVASL